MTPFEFAKAIYVPDSDIGSHFNNVRWLPSKAEIFLDVRRHDGFTVSIITGDLINQQGMWIRYRAIFGHERISVLRIKNRQYDEFYWQHEPSEIQLVKARLMGVF